MSQNLPQDLCEDFVQKARTLDRPLQVLVVSHGGVIKELMFHLASAGQCQMPSGYKLMPGNASISRVALKLRGKRVQEVTCASLYDVTHLTGLDLLQDGACA
jgi:broad specificity phosphatase PhoE